MQLDLWLRNLQNLATDIPGVSRISGSNPERLLTAGTAAEPMLGRGGILLCPRGFPAVTVRLKLRDGAAKSPCTCGLDSEIYKQAITLLGERVQEQYRFEKIAK